MNVIAGVRFGPTICRPETIEDCYPAARLLVRRLRHAPQIVLMDPLGNVHLLPGYAVIPEAAVCWIVGSYNKDATLENVAADLANEMRERRRDYRGAL